MNDLTPAPSASLVPQNIDQAMKLAEMMAASKLVPSHLQKQPADCFLVIEQAMRWGMSPFAVAQCTSVISGKLMFEGKLVAAALESCGALSGHLDYRFTGEGPERAIIVSGTLAGDKAPRTVTVRWKDAKTNNALWTKQPDQQLVYHGARVWARRWAPAVILGVYSREEFPVGEGGAPAFEGTTIDAVAEHDGTHDGVTAAVPYEEQPKPRQKLGDWLRDVEADLAAAEDAEAVQMIRTRPDVAKALTALQGDAAARLAAALQNAMDRVMPFPGDAVEGAEDVL